MDQSQKTGTFPSSLQASASGVLEKSSSASSGINNYDDYKNLKKMGISRKLKLEQMREKTMQKNIKSNGSISINKQAIDESENIQISQSKEKRPSLLNQNQEINGNVLKKKERIEFNKPGQIVLDTQLIEKAKPLIQKITEIDLEENDPQRIPKFHSTIQSFKKSQQSWVDRSNNINQSVQKLKYEHEKVQSFDDSDPDRNLILKLMQQNQSISDFNDGLSPFEPFFNKQEQQLKQKQKNRGPKVISNQKNETENFYQDQQEEYKDQTSDQKKWSNELVRKFNFEKMNIPVKQGNQNSYYEDIDEVQNLEIEQIQCLNEEMDFGSQQIPQIFIIQRDTLLPEMYPDQLLKMPAFLEQDQLEIFLTCQGNPRPYSNPSKQNEMIFNQISPNAREIIRQFNWIEETFEQQHDNNNILNSSINNQDYTKIYEISPKNKFSNQIKNEPPHTPQSNTNKFDVAFLKNDTQQVESPVASIPSKSGQISPEQIQNAQKQEEEQKEIPKNIDVKLTNFNSATNYESQFERPVRDANNNGSDEKVVQDSTQKENFWSHKGMSSELGKKVKIEKVLGEIDSLINSRKMIKKSEERNITIKLERKLNELLEFVRFDNQGNDIFGTITSQEFLSSFPQNVEKIKGQTVGGFSKIKLLYVFFQNYLPLTQELPSLKQKKPQEKKAQRTFQEDISYIQSNNVTRSASREIKQRNQQQKKSSQNPKRDLSYNSNPNITITKPPSQLNSSKTARSNNGNKPQQKQFSPVQKEKNGQTQKDSKQPNEKKSGNNQETINQKSPFQKVVQQINIKPANEFIIPKNTFVFSPREASSISQHSVSNKSFSNFESVSQINSKGNSSSKRNSSTSNNSLSLPKRTPPTTTLGTMNSKSPQKRDQVINSLSTLQVPTHIEYNNQIVDFRKGVTNYREQKNILNKKIY